MADLISQGKLVGTLSGGGTLRGSISTTLPSVSGTITVPKIVGVDPYDGVTEVTPRVYVQSLETNGKYMTNDVTVYEIPVTYTSNPQGGQTVLIG